MTSVKQHTTRATHATMCIFCTECGKEATLRIPRPVNMGLEHKIFQAADKQHFLRLRSGEFICSDCIRRDAMRSRRR